MGEGVYENRGCQEDKLPILCLAQADSTIISPF